MPTNYTDARNEIFALVNNALISDEAIATLGQTPVTFWQGVEESTPPGNNFWSRTSMQTALEGQDTLSTVEGAPGQKLYNSQGLVFVQLFVPKTMSTGYAKGQSWAVMVRNAFRGVRADCVTFRNMRIQELPPESLYWRFNVVCQFSYSEIL